MGPPQGDVAVPTLLGLQTQGCLEGCCPAGVWPRMRFASWADTAGFNRHTGTSEQQPARRVLLTCRLQAGVGADPNIIVLGVAPDIEAGLCLGTAVLIPLGVEWSLLDWSYTPRPQTAPVRTVSSSPAIPASVNAPPARRG